MAAAVILLVHHNIPYKCPKGSFHLHLLVLQLPTISLNNLFCTGFHHEKERRDHLLLLGTVNIKVPYSLQQKGTSECS